MSQERGGGTLVAAYIYNVDDDLDSEDERKKHGSGKGKDVVELYSGIRYGDKDKSQADNTVQ